MIDLIKRKIANYRLLSYKKAHISYDSEKEIVVWLRLKDGLDKYQCMEFVKDKFNLNDSDAENIFYKAFPDGFSEEEIELIKKSYLELEKHIRKANITYKKEQEIVVQLRLMDGLDKQQCIEFVKDKFNLNDADATDMFYKAFPDGLSEEEINLIKKESRDNYTQKILLESIQNVGGYCFNMRYSSIQNIDPVVFEILQNLFGRFMYDGSITLP